MRSLRLQALADLVRRYVGVWRAVWGIRAQLERAPRAADQLAFLPAELELVETPVHPAPRWTMRVLILLSVIVLLIGVVGRLDIVVTASGQFVPNARVKVIQPAITGVVREIRVRDGERVAPGQLLMKLDATLAAADADKARSSLLDAELAAARANALLASQRDNRLPVVGHVEGVSEARMQDAQRQAESAWLEYRAQYDGAHAELLKRQAALDSTRAEIAKLVRTSPLARQQADAYQALVADRYVARNEYLQKEQDALEKEHDLNAQRSHANELAAGIAEQRAQIETTVSKFRRDQLDELEKDTQQIAQSRNDETKAQTRQSLLSLTAPVAGTVQQLNVHTLGGVVTTAQSLMEIVPDDALEVEARLQNKDIGFVEVGQHAAVKIEAFPFTRYGYLRGTVMSVSNDAVQDKKLGPTFPVRIRLETSRIHIDNRWITLSPGMAVTADIRTGKRSVIGYFFDPLLRTSQESMRER
ncbi:HlyD family type I secretion periplasmic adaptor subunit [Paraburkholderia caribensis]|uniref:HlyD family type I secretion periplasmic adaptor subunit n=1 Tax=Paraburkholderia caribensis TaxID=75105 RepID=UPI0007206BE6|nr:HlyD family type I secretion periplasmic adaptor subunit [Paraburkholderia caribensis]ALP66628.1 hemolysin D [Paraburkholderia caribensis]AUT56078.1 HlyD family type I secretion periplasmic adaptor subunit [Paraburkholderia caribensis]